MKNRHAFTLLEIMLTLSVVALIMAAMAPALIGSLRALATWRAMITPLRQDRLAFTVLREDLWACPRPIGSLDLPFVLDSDGSIHCASLGPLPLHPGLADDAASRLALITWSISEDDEGLLRWQRARDPHLLASGRVPEALPDIYLEHCSSLSVRVLIGETVYDKYDSNDHDARLPDAVEIRFSRPERDGSPGPEQRRVISLPQVALDPLQAETP